MKKTGANASLQVILDCMSGMDGGVSYSYLSELIREMQELSERGDKDAAKLCDIVNSMAKLITYVAEEHA